MLAPGSLKGHAMNRSAAVLLALCLAGACASAPAQGGPRPPQGPGPAGTDFGRWDIDAEGAVDQAFRIFITRRWNGGQEAEARRILEADGFTCRDGNRPDAQPVPSLACERVYSLNDNVHAWTVQFRPNEPEPRSNYSRMHRRDPMRNYDSRGN
jgi:hypothetical protein